MKIKVETFLTYGDQGTPFDRSEKNELLKLLDVFVSNSKTPALGDFLAPDEETYEINIEEE